MAAEVMAVPVNYKGHGGVIIFERIALPPLGLSPSRSQFLVMPDGTRT